VIVAAAGTGSFRRLERVSMALVAGSLLLIPIFFVVASWVYVTGGRRRPGRTRLTW
jgi:hypothetical protein